MKTSSSSTVVKGMSRRAAVGAGVLVASVVMLRCSSERSEQAPPATDAMAPDVHQDVRLPPREHRASSTPCRKTRPEGGASPTFDAGGCKVDDECDAGVNGRCGTQVDKCGGGVCVANLCSYDDCFEDTECAAREVCACETGAFEANECLLGDCRVDSDCADGDLCSPSAIRAQLRTGAPGSSPKPPNVARGWFCHRSTDECTNDEECPGDGDDRKCAYRTDVNHWGCTMFSSVR